MRTLATPTSRDDVSLEKGAYLLLQQAIALASELDAATEQAPRGKRERDRDIETKRESETRR